MNPDPLSLIPDPCGIPFSMDPDFLGEDPRIITSKVQQPRTTPKNRLSLLLAFEFQSNTMRRRKRNHETARGKDCPDLWDRK